MIRKLLGAGLLGVFGYRFFSNRKKAGHAAFSSDQPQGSHLDVRDAGPAAMRDKPKRERTETDEKSDESFPASDPPGGY